MATIIKLCSTHSNYNTFEVNGKILVYVTEFKDGIVTVEPSAGMMIHDFASVIEGCFSPRSNFKKEILKTFNCDANAEVIGIKCLFNDVHICTATRESFRREWIVSSWREHFSQ